MKYNDPANGSPSSVGAQQREDFYKRAALIEVAEELYFGQFANTEAMPRHYGKKIKQDHYLPILHDGNLTDQGIDANGLSVNQKVTITIVAGGAVRSYGADNRENGLGTHYAVGEGSSAAAALTAAQADAVNIFKNLGVFDTNYATTVTAIEALDPAWTVIVGTAVPATGNLWGSSRDMGTVQGKLPFIGEDGGRLNRVGSTRVSIESQMQNMGIFEEYSADAIDFDSDKDFEMHMHRELLRAAAEIQEDALQIDLLNGAGLIRFGGDAISTSEVTGEASATASEITYDDLTRMDIDLTNNGAPKKIKAVLGSTKTDTKTVQSARPMIIGSELIPTLHKMKDNFQERAFKYVHEYADGTKPMNGEVGAVGPFRVIVSPRMMYEAGAGATVTTNGGYRETNGKYDVYPMLIPSQGSFSEISFHSSNGGKAGEKWTIHHRKPGYATMGKDDPFGKKGIKSIQWWYGSLIPRPEHVGLFKCVAQL